MRKDRGREQNEKKRERQRREIRMRKKRETVRGVIQWEKRWRGRVRRDGGTE